MLTSDLVRVRLPRGGAIAPTFIKPNSKDLLETAETLVALLNDGLAERWTKGQVDQAILEAIGDRRDQKLIRGVAKIILDRCTFEVATPLPPTELREAVFLAAHAAGGVSLTSGPLGHATCDTVMLDVAQSMGMDPNDLASALYGDLPDEQRLTAFDAKEPTWLLNRYNVSLVQSVLLHATQVRIVLDEPTVPRIRQLMRWAKFYQLVHSATRDGKALVLTLDGPGSIFHQSSRYGMQLASFFPALLLQDGPWTATASVRWKRTDKELTIDPSSALVSHYRDTGNYETQVHEWFVERFKANKQTAWKLDRRVRPMDLGGRSVILPDYRLTNGDRTAYIEILGYWKKDYLNRRLEALRRHGPGNLILAVSKKMGDVAQLASEAAEVVPFAKIVPVKDVLAAAEKVAK